MQFDSLINNLLKEKVSREDRIKALKSMANKSFRVIEVAAGRAVDIISDEIVIGSSIEEVAEEEAIKAKQIIRDQFAGDYEQDLMNAEEYIEHWFEGPAYNEDRSQAQFNSSEEGYTIILSTDSKYFDYSEEYLHDNWREMSNEIKWGR